MISSIEIDTYLDTVNREMLISSITVSWLIMMFVAVFLVLCGR